MTTNNRKVLKTLLIGILLFTVSFGYAQQEPQFTQYMYNTMSVNPAYAGQRNALNVTFLHREQWVGIDGAPGTQTLVIHSPLRNKAIGLGLSVVREQIGPLSETYVDANYSYTVWLSYNLRLSFGLKTGMHYMKTDWSKGTYKDPDLTYAENISQLAPTFGTGVYLHSQKWYLGAATANFLETRHYTEIQVSKAKDKIHYYLIGGYVFDVSSHLKLKPAFLLKCVSGAPLITDVSLNAKIFDRLVVGTAWRWGDSFSTLVGVHISKNLFAGYAYDLTTSNLHNYNSGSHEIMLRYELKSVRRLLSPRFF